MRSNPPHIRYDREALKAVLTELTVHNENRVTRILDEYEKQRAEGPDRPCQSMVHHGPGHQSSTFCQETGGHEYHCAVLPSSGMFAEWTDDRPYSEWSN